jgi:hypothetical protein
MQQEFCAGKKAGLGKRAFEVHVPKEREKKRFQQLHKSVAKMNDLAAGKCSVIPSCLTPGHLSDR